MNYNIKSYKSSNRGGTVLYKPREESVLQVWGRDGNLGRFAVKFREEGKFKTSRSLGGTSQSRETA